MSIEQPSTHSDGYCYRRLGLCRACPFRFSSRDSGVNVLGLDVDPEKVNALNEGRSYIKHVSAETIADQVKANRLEATTDFCPSR